MMLPNSKFNNPSTCLNTDSHARSLPINSPIWKYYEKLEHNQNVVKCLCCHPSFESSVIPLRKTIDNLWRHLGKHHRKEYFEAKEEVSNNRIIWRSFTKFGTNGMVKCRACSIQISTVSTANSSINLESILWEHLKHNHQAEYQGAIKERDEHINSKFRYSEVYFCVLFMSRENKIFRKILYL